MNAAEFLRDYWQKKPLLVRNAFPNFGGALDRDGLLDLAARDDVESRCVAHDATSWDVEFGPFSATKLKRRKGPWTVLVQGVNQYLAAGDALLQEFNFIPHARLDDLMVSYASDGGGVGPHIDNYDVFLIQGIGQRRWRIGRPRDRRLIDDAPLKILRNFVPDEEWVLNPGDMLYLPPDYAHDGVAVGPCMTWSVGFRTVPTEELVDQFLLFLQDDLRARGKLSGRYADPDLQIQRHPGEIGPEMVQQVAKMLEAIRWEDSLVRDFLGHYLSDPKSNVLFDPPGKTLSPQAFQHAAQRHGVQLDLKSRLLFSGSRFYLNGEALPCPANCRAALRQLSDHRFLRMEAFETEIGLASVLHEAYAAGYIHLKT